MLSSSEIAKKTKLQQIQPLANTTGIRMDELEPYGHYKAKVSLEVLNRYHSRPFGKLVLVTGMTPTKQGDGKTTTSIGLTQALGALKKKVILCLREPSLAPIFGKKGGATGFGYAQVLPAEDINLHFTGDAHAIAAAHNLLAAAVENHIHHGNTLGLQKDKIFWRRSIDLSDRQLRDIEVGLSKACNRSRLKSGFDVTASSEVMACLALCSDISSLKSKLSKIVVGINQDGRPVTAKELKVVGAMAMLLKDAIKPNLVQTLEGQPVFIHTGPFANVSVGNNSVIATSMALKLANYVVTEAGFATDLGFEKFVNIVSKDSGFAPSVCVVVATVKAIKQLSDTQNRTHDDMFRWESYKNGFANLMHHVATVQKHGIHPVVAINRFPQDSDEDIKLVCDYLTSQNVDHAVSEAGKAGSKGALSLADRVLKALTEKPSNFKRVVKQDISFEEKLRVIAREYYGAHDVSLSATAKKQLEMIRRMKLDNLAVNVAKTPYSLTDDPQHIQAPLKWTLKVKELRLFAGAGYIVAVCGKLLLMPGLPEKAQFENMDITDDGVIKGLL